MNPSEEGKDPTGSASTRMTIWEHLQELRSVLLWGLIFVVLGVVGAAIFASSLFQLLLFPLKQVQADLVLHTFSPPEIVVMYLKISLVGGLALSSPFWLWVVLGFVVPGLTEREKRMIIPAGLAGLLLFAAGVLFTYYVVLPITLEFLWQFNLQFGLTPQWRVNYYLNFVLTLCVIFGVTFELPLLVTILAQMGIASPEFLRQKRGHVIVALVLLSALLTPPDVVTQLLMTIPLWILYEISILLAGLVYPYEH